MAIKGTLQKKHPLRLCARYMRRNTHHPEKSHHLWINDIEDIRVRRAVRDIKLTISAHLETCFADYDITNIPEIDEAYYAPSPHKVTHADTSLTCPHYDTPFGGLYMQGARFYRVVVACTKNKTVHTRFSGQMFSMNLGDFHALDYNNDLHSVEGEIPDGKHRILLKLHYAVIPTSENVENIYALCSTHVVIQWTRWSMYFMRAGSSPQNLIECAYGPIIDGLRSMHNWRMRLSTAMLVCAPTTV